MTQVHLQSRHVFNDGSFAGFHSFVSEGQPNGSFEVFFDSPDIPKWGCLPRNYDSKGNPVKEGWYWWCCRPGCSPDGEANGPYPTARGAYEAAIGE